MILITGASGFIGRYVVKNLIENNCDILVVTRRKDNYVCQGNEEVVECDLNSTECVNKLRDVKGIETLIHLAWEGIPDYGYDMSERNLRMGLNVLNICKDCGISNLVITGSCWEYFNPSGEVSVHDAITYDGAFHAAKASLYQMAHAFCLENNVHLNWLRLFYVYGPGQKEKSLIPHIISSFNQGKYPELSGAYNENDFIYVEDVAKAIVKIASNHSYSEVINIGTGEAIRVLEIVRYIAKQYNLQEQEPEYSVGQPKKFYANIKEINAEIGDMHLTSIYEGIDRMI